MGGGGEGSTQDLTCCGKEDGREHFKFRLRVCLNEFLDREDLLSYGGLFHVIGSAYEKDLQPVGGEELVQSQSQALQINSRHACQTGAHFDENVMSARLFYDRF